MADASLPFTHIDERGILHMSHEAPQLASQDQHNNCYIWSDSHDGAAYRSYLNVYNYDAGDPKFVARVELPATDYYTFILSQGEWIPPPPEPPGDLVPKRFDIRFPVYATWSL